MKYSWEFKLQCVNKYKNGEYITTPGKTGNQRTTFMHHVEDVLPSLNEFFSDLIINTHIKMFSLERNVFMVD